MLPKVPRQTFGVASDGSDTELPQAVKIPQKRPRNDGGSGEFAPRETRFTGGPMRGARFKVITGDRRWDPPLDKGEGA
jgi:hypothetical protein